MILDILVIVMLFICTTYCIVLSRRIQSMKEHRQGFKKLIAELENIILKAEGTTKQLSKMSMEAKENLLKLKAGTESLIQDLELMNDIGGDLATRLEKITSKARLAEKDLKDSMGKVTIKSPSERQNIDTLLAKLSIGGPRI